MKVGAMAAAEREGMTEAARTTLRLFAASVARAYGDRLNDLIVFGSRARGDAGPNSDLDVAVILSAVAADRFAEGMALADLAYDAIVETGVALQPWPISIDEWRNPELHANPALVRAMRRDGRRFEAADLARLIFESALLQRGKRRYAGLGEYL